jgi:hypothetical protein
VQGRDICFDFQHFKKEYVVDADSKRWRDLTRTEPRLRELEAAALALHRGDEDVEWGDWEEIKRRLSLLVGWWSANERLRSHKDYEAAYSWLLHCWECGRRPGEPFVGEPFPWELPEQQKGLFGGGESAVAPAATVGTPLATTPNHHITNHA